MANLRAELEAAEEFYGERIEALVVGKHYSRSWANDTKLPDEEVVLSREDGLKKLDEEYDDGFGGADCYPLYAWTASRVFFVHEYDGATAVNWAPRNPVAIEPQFGGNDQGRDEIAKIVAARKAVAQPLAEKR